MGLLARPDENPQPHDIDLACTSRDTEAKIQLILKLLGPILWENCQIIYSDSKGLCGKWDVDVNSFM